MGQMNIKDDALIEEAKALAELLGTSTTDAVRQAVHERLERERRERAAEYERRLRALEAIVARTAPLLAGPDEDYDHDKLLYDAETGLPR